MSKKVKIYLYDILEAIEAIESYIKDIDYEEFANNRLIRHGTIKELEIIGEAVKNIPKRNKRQISTNTLEKHCWNEGYFSSCIF